MSLRSVKVLDIAVFDVVATAALAWLVFLAVRRYRAYPARRLGVLAFVVFVWVFLTGVIVHLAFGVDTKLGFYLGLNRDPRA